MRLGEALHDGEARAAGPVRGLAACETVEDARLGAARDARRAVQDVDHVAASAHASRDLDRPLCGRIPGGVVDQGHVGVMQRLGVGADERERGVDGGGVLAPGQRRGEVGDGCGNDVRQVRRSKVGRERALPDPGEVEEIGQEAIQVLETKGLVQRRHGERTTVVRKDVTEYLGTLAVTVRQKFRDDPDYLLHLMAARRMVETEVVSLLTSRDDPVAAGVTAALDGMRRARDAGDFAGFVDADVAFHLALVHSAQNPILTVLHDNLFGLIDDVIQVTSRVPSKSLEAAYSEHHEIWLRIADRDRIGATGLMRAQIDNQVRALACPLFGHRAEPGRRDRQEGAGGERGSDHHRRRHDRAGRHRLRRH